MIAIFFSNKPITLKNTNNRSLVNKIENPTKCKVLKAFQETLPFVDWLIAILKFCTFLNGFSLVVAR